MKKLGEVPFDKIYKGMPVMIPAWSYFEVNPRFSHYGETLFFEEIHGVVIDRYHGEWEVNKKIGDWITIQFGGSRFPYRASYETIKHGNICLDSTRM